MPLFVYQCQDCQHQQEVLVRSENQEIKCEKCGSKNLKKLLTTFNVGKNSSSSFSSCADGSCGLPSTCSTGSCGCGF